MFAVLVKGITGCSPAVPDKNFVINNHSEPYKIQVPTIICINSVCELRFLDNLIISFWPERTTLCIAYCSTLRCSQIHNLPRLSTCECVNPEISHFIWGSCTENKIVLYVGMLHIFTGMIFYSRRIMSILSCTRFISHNSLVSPQLDSITTILVSPQ